jgi:hypothetical protein
VELRRKFHEFAAAAVLMGGVSGGIGAQLASWIDNADENYTVEAGFMEFSPDSDFDNLPYPEALSEADRLMREEMADVVTAEDKKISVAEDIGALCVTTLEPYIEGVLIEASEDTIMDDLASDSRKPCGAEPTIIRKNYRTWRQVVSEYEEAAALPESTQAEIDTIRSQMAEDDKGDYADNGFWVLGTIGLIGGLAVAENRYRNRRYYAWRAQAYAASEYRAEIEDEAKANYQANLEPVVEALNSIEHD